MTSNKKRRTILTGLSEHGMVTAISRCIRWLHKIFSTHQSKMYLKSHFVKVTVPFDYDIFPWKKPLILKKDRKKIPFYHLGRHLSVHDDAIAVECAVVLYFSCSIPLLKGVEHFGGSFHHIRRGDDNERTCRTVPTIMCVYSFLSVL